MCSRGMMMSRTAESIDINKENMLGYWLTEYTHDKEIPEAQNAVVDQALKHGPEFIWFVEEDVVPPITALVKMVEYSVNNRVPVVTAWYKLDGGFKSYELSYDNSTLLFAGQGCLLVQARVFEQLKRPFFRSDTIWSPRYHENKLVREHDAPSEVTYGKQDIHFFGTLQEAGVGCALVEIECLHLGVDKWGAQGNNRGVHKLRLKQ